MKNIVSKKPERPEEKTTRDVLNTTDRRANLTDEQDVEQASAKKQKMIMTISQTLLKRGKKKFFTQKILFKIHNSYQENSH